jgi:cephalosporin-C deacetylase-like acetyl esterase
MLRFLLAINALLTYSFFVVATFRSVQADETRWNLLPDQLPSGVSPSNMVRDGLLRSAENCFQKNLQQFEQLQSAEQIYDYQQHLKQEFLQRIGGLPESSLLNAVTTGQISRPGYKIEKVLFESQPRFYVTAALFLPDAKKFAPPWPGVMILCGHATEGKLQDGYQRGASLAALSGLAALIVDPIGQGERLQILEAEGQKISPTTEHTLLGTGAITVGWNTARWMIHDGLRAIDYLQSRSDIRGDRIGVMGNSGGGTQTSYLMALDNRVVAAAPSCYITSFKKLLNTIGPQDAEQNIFGQIELGMDHAEYLVMRAPRATLIACATQDFFDIDGTWQSYRLAKRLFHRLGHGRSIELVEVEAEHGWHPLQRRASVQFMRQHLSQELGDIDDPAIEPLTADEMRVTPDGQVLRIAGAISAFDHVRTEGDRCSVLRSQKGQPAEQLASQVRRLAGIRELNRLPDAEVTWLNGGSNDSERNSPDHLFSVENVKIGRLILKREDGTWLPGVLAEPSIRPDTEVASRSSETTNVTCLLLEEGLSACLNPEGEILRRALVGQTVLAVDIRGIGQTAPSSKHWYNERFGINSGNAMIAYLLGKSLVGCRSEDCLVVARWLAQQTGAQTINIVASGEAAIPALHAAALEPGLINKLELRRCLESWSELTRTPLSVNQVAGLVHAALPVYDLPDLAALLGDRLTMKEPLDGRGRPKLSGSGTVLGD